jgi:CheY-like chemotaxis protein
LATILLVEDDAMSREILTRRLERRGYDVVTATNGQEGVAKATSVLPDLILMDMSLPYVDGWQATRQLKQARETRSIPIVALTAHAMAGDKQKALEAGCDDYECKPVDLPRLLEKIAALLEPKER